MGRALGEDEVQCAATPTGLFVSLDGEDATGFRAVGAPLRFDQSAAVSRIVDAVLARDLRSRRGGRRLDAVLAAPPLLPRWAVAAGLIPVSAGIGLILQPAAENLLAGVLCSVLVAVLIEVAARSKLALRCCRWWRRSWSAARSSSPPTTTCSTGRCGRCCRRSRSCCPAR